MASQTDYYRILQVHEDADQELISAAYKCLSKLYHPDVNRSSAAVERMTDINVAYSVIGDERRRKEYHREWIRQQKGRTETLSSLLKNRETKKIEAAGLALDDYFRSMVNGQWESSYQKLTSIDKANIPCADFIKWKNAVSEVYKLGNYQMHYLQRFESCEYGGVIYPEVLQFTMNLTEYNRITEQMETEQTEKYIAFENGVWKVCLGYTDLKPSIMRFICLAQTLPKVDKDEICRRAIINVDPLTGLLSRNGFVEESEKEILRSRRYGNPLTLAVLTVKPTQELSKAFDESLSEACVAYVAGKLDANLRKTDLLGRCSESAFSILLTETEFDEAEHAMKKMLRCVSEEDQLNCHLAWGFTRIEDGSIDEAIENAFFIASEHEKRTMEEDDAEIKTDRDPTKLGKYDLYDILRFNRKWKNHF